MAVCSSELSVFGQSVWSSYNLGQTTVSTVAFSIPQDIVYTRLDHNVLALALLVKQKKKHKAPEVHQENVHFCCKADDLNWIAMQLH